MNISSSILQIQTKKLIVYSIKIKYTPGNSARPAYPGFIVMNGQHVGLSTNSVPSKINLSTPFILAS